VARIARRPRPPEAGKSRTHGRPSQRRAGAIAVPCLHRRAAMSGTRDRAGLAPVVYVAQSREKKLGLFRDEEGSVQVKYGTGATIPIPLKAPPNLARLQNLTPPRLTPVSLGFTVY
jgi:hypothetical protein